VIESIFGWFLSAATALLSGILTLFMDAMDLSLGKIIQYFPVLVTGYEMFQTMAIGFIVLIAAFQLFKFFTGPLFEAKETPLAILVRAGVAGCAVYFGGHVLDMVVDMAKVPYQAFLDLAMNPGALTGAGSVSGGIADILLGTVERTCKEILAIGASAVTGSLVGANILLSLILTLLIGWNVLKLAVEICARYLMVGLLAYSAPLPFSSIASAQTSIFFQHWLGMFLGHCIIMALSMWSYDVVLSGMVSISFTAAGDPIFFRLILVFAVCRIGQRIDSYMQRLGIGVGTTGGSLLDELVFGLVFGAKALSLMASGTAFGKGADGTGHRKDSVLGGTSDDSGRVKPEAFGSGLLGSVVTGGRYAADAYKNGASGKDVAAAAAEGAKKGFGLDGDGSSFIFGRKLGSKLNDMQQSRKEARSAATTAKDGGVYKSADGKHSTLDAQAQSKGLTLDRNNAVKGNPTASGRFMAANFNKAAAHDVLQHTAREGSPVSSEEALFGTHNALEYSPDSEISREQVDQLGSDMMAATFSAGLNDLDMKEAEGWNLSQDEQNIQRVGEAMRSSMAGKTENGHLRDFHAKDIGEGRTAVADLVDDKGNVIGSVMAVDDKSYGMMNAEERQGFVPIRSATGASYCMRASGVTVGGDGESQVKWFGATVPITEHTGAGNNKGTESPGAAAAAAAESNTTAPDGVRPFPNEGSPIPEKGEQSNREASYFKTTDALHPEISAHGQENGVTLASSKGTTVIQSDDSTFAASAINEGLASGNYAVNKLATDTIQSDVCTQNVAEEALYSKDSGAITKGHDAEVASMMNKVFDNPTELNNAVGSAVTTNSTQPLISSEDASHFASAIQSAAKGESTDGATHYCDNFSKSADGVLSCDYHTPNGDYKVQTMQNRTFDEAGGIEQSNTTGISTSDLKCDETGYKVAVSPAQTLSGEPVTVSSFALPNSDTDSAALIESTAMGAPAAMEAESTLSAGAAEQGNHAGLHKDALTESPSNHVPAMGYSTDTTPVVRTEAGVSSESSHNGNPVSQVDGTVSGIASAGGASTGVDSDVVLPANTASVVPAEARTSSGGSHNENPASQVDGTVPGIASAGGASTGVDSGVVLPANTAPVVPAETRMPNGGGSPVAQVQEGVSGSVDSGTVLPANTSPVISAETGVSGEISSSGTAAGAEEVNVSQIVPEPLADNGGSVSGSFTDGSSAGSFMDSSPSMSSESHAFAQGSLRRGEGIGGYSDDSISASASQTSLSTGGAGSSGGDSPLPVLSDSPSMPKPGTSDGAVTVDSPGTFNGGRSMSTAQSDDVTFTQVTLDSTGISKSGGVPVEIPVVVSGLDGMQISPPVKAPEVYVPTNIPAAPRRQPVYKAPLVCRSTGLS